MHDGHVCRHDLASKPGIQDRSAGGCGYERDGVTSNRKRHERALHLRLRWSEASKARSRGFSI
jgi:hypothetical protein